MRPSGFAIATWCYTQGAYVAQYLSFSRMLINIFCFNIVWVFIECLPVIFATRYGIDLWIWLRSVLGRRGVAVLSTIISVANFGWYAVAASLFSSSMINLAAKFGLVLNKDEMKRELEWFKRKGVIVRILDIPTTLIDFKDQTWVLEMVNNILIEVLGAVAEQERKKTKQRQAEGIAAMPVVDGKRVSVKTGRGFGRPASEIDDEQFEKLAQKQKDGLITVADCCRELGISRSTWYDRVRKAG